MSITRFYAAVQLALASKRGAAMIEYALLVALIAVAAIAALQGLGGGITAKLQSVSTSLAGAH